MKQYVFISEVYVEAEDEDEAWEKEQDTLEADLYNNCCIYDVDSE